jgi:hypothetical protein
MTAHTTSYSMTNVVATVDRRQIIGFWDGDDVVSVAMSGNVSTTMVGADGSSINSVSADKSAEISIKLQHTSPTHRFLHQKLKQMRARGANATPFSFTVKDKVSGEGGVADKCVIMTAPADGKGKNASMREWKLTTGEFIPEIPGS